jgi:antitoxin MazE
MNVVMNLTQPIRKWGNGAGIRLPKKVTDAANLKLNQQLAISLKGKSVVLTPIDEPRKSRVKLDDLLAGITPDNQHNETEWGEPVGKESW